MRALLSALAGLIFAGCASEPHISYAPSVTAAELLSTPKNFAGKRLVVTGFWISGFEWSYLSDRQDIKQHSPIWVESDNSSSHAKEIHAAVNRAYKEAQRRPAWDSRDLWIKCVGRFDHAEFPTTDEHGNLRIGFGHMGAYTSRLIIEEIQEARIIPFTRN